MRLEDLDFDLPEGLVAQHPAARRDASRLLAMDRAGAPLRHLSFHQLPELLRAPDVLVVNQTRVVPARLRGRKAVTGGRVEILLLRQDAPGQWLAMARPLRGLKPADRIVLDRACEELEVIERVGDRIRLQVPGTASAPDADPTGFLSMLPLAERAGEVPLPPYIRRSTEPADQERYQTVFARDPGSIAAPTAGLHFTEALLQAVEDMGVAVVRVVLHVGPGTFEPIRASDPRQHRVEAEYYRLPEAAAATIRARRQAGGRVIAVGTTTVRALESAAAQQAELQAAEGWTELVIGPGHRFRAVDALVTNFHLPRSSLVMLVSAFAGREPLLAAYREAVHQGYRFYSYGDAMFIA